MSERQELAALHAGQKAHTMTKQEQPTELTLWLTAAIDKWREKHPNVMVSEILESLEDIGHTLTEALIRQTPR